MKENKGKFKRTKRHYCAKQKCSKCEFFKSMPYECCSYEIALEKNIYRQEADHE